MKYARLRLCPSMVGAKASNVVNAEGSDFQSNGNSKGPSPISKEQPTPHQAPRDKGDIVTLRLEQARSGVLTDLRCFMELYAERYAVPMSILEGMIVDWALAERTRRGHIPEQYYTRMMEDRGDH